MFKDLLPNNFFDLIFIDGAHDYDNVYFDIKQALVSLKAGSILCGHDYHSQGVGVIKAVNELVFQNPNTRRHATIPETSLWIATFN
jgi:predicted O-methyltransferase YrrM